MAAKTFLALDQGAESGRGLLGHLADGRLTLEEIHRFPNTPVQVLNTLHWNVLSLFREMQEAIGRAGEHSLAGIGLDTWGVDFGLIGRNGQLTGLPVHYRDGRTQGMLERAFELVPKEEIFETTGIQIMQINTLYQMLSLVLNDAPQLAAAETFLTIPDLLNYFFTGERVSEFSNATTTQMVDPRAKDWARGMLDRLGIPHRILPNIVSPGTILGPLTARVAEATGVGKVPVIAPACHDTGSAVAAVPASSESWCYISCGTWSLLGAELAEPLISPAAFAANFTNEGGVGGTFRFLKNIMGLWLVQECRRTWQRAGDDLDYDQITQLANDAPAFTALVDPDDTLFLAPGDMPARIQQYCQQTEQAVPADRGAVVRTCLESLVLKYRASIEHMEGVLGRQIDTVHIVGGGTKNKLLCQWTADATGRPVVAGPVEATAIGNLLVQAMAVGELGSLSDLREVVRQSFDVIRYEPGESQPWDEAYDVFQRKCS